MSPGQGEQAAGWQISQITSSQHHQLIVPQSQNYGENGAQPTLAKRQVGKLRQETIVVPGEETRRGSYPGFILVEEQASRGQQDGHHAGHRNVDEGLLAALAGGRLLPALLCAQNKARVKAGPGPTAILGAPQPAGPPAPRPRPVAGAARGWQLRGHPGEAELRDGLGADPALARRAGAGRCCRTGGPEPAGLLREDGASPLLAWILRQVAGVPLHQLAVPTEDGDVTPGQAQRPGRILEGFGTAGWSCLLHPGGQGQCWVT